MLRFTATFHPASLKPVAFLGVYLRLQWKHTTLRVHKKAQLVWGNLPWNKRVIYRGSKSWEQGSSFVAFHTMLTCVLSQYCPWECYWIPLNQVDLQHILFLWSFEVYRTLGSFHMDIFQCERENRWCTHRNSFHGFPNEVGRLLCIFCSPSREYKLIRLFLLHLVQEGK